MNICIYGAGVIGGILAAAFARAGHKVCLIARGAHLEALRKNGLTLKNPAGTQTYSLPASDDPADFGPQDFVAVCTKTPALPGVAKSIPPLLGPDTLVGFSVNGIFWFYGDGFAPGGQKLDLSRLDPDGLLHANIGRERAVGMVAWAGGEIYEPGVVTARQGGRFAIGAALPEKNETVKRLVEDFAVTDYDLQHVHDVRAPMWAKYLQVAGNFATCALTGGSIGEVQSDPATLDVLLALSGEADAVARAHGYETGFDAAKARANPATSPHKPSMLQDLERGRTMEIDSAYLVLQDLARQAGIRTPVLDIVVPLLCARARLAGCHSG